MAFAAVTAEATMIRDARIDSTGKNLLLDVTYGGGCGEHDFSLELQGCAESFPAQCTAKLIHRTQDFCEALISKTVTVNLAQNGIKGSYYSEASLQVYVDMNGNGKQDKNDLGMLSETSAVVRLPKMKDSDDSGVPVGGQVSSIVTCTTHTGSKLKIFALENEVQLTTTNGEVHIYQVSEKSHKFLESNPPQLQTKYALDDGRSIVTTFMDDRITGKGYFVRLDGTTSPAFTCQRNIVNDVE